MMLLLFDNLNDSSSNLQFVLFFRAPFENPRVTMSIPVRATNYNKADSDIGLFLLSHPIALDYAQTTKSYSFISVYSNNEWGGVSRIPSSKY